MADETVLNIKWVAEAQDKATEVLSKIQGTVSQVQKAYQQFSDEMAKTGNAAKALGSIVGGGTGGIEGFGKAALTAGALFATLYFAVTKVTDAVADMAYSLGRTLTNAAKISSNEMISAEETLYKYNSTVNTFAMATDGATGSIENWNKFIVDMNKKTSISSETLQEMAVDMISMGNAAGLTAGEMQRIIKISADYSRITGRNVLDINSQIVLGLQGFGRGLKQMGINLDDAAMISGKYARYSKQSYDALSESGKVQARLNALTEQWKLIATSASGTSGTYAMRQKILADQWNNLLIAIGKGSAIITEAFVVPMTKVLALLNSLPGPLKAAAGFVIALGGVMATLAGVLVTVTTTAIAAAAAIWLLNRALQSTSVQTAFATTIPIINKSLKEMLVLLGVSQIELTSVGGLARTAFAALKRGVVVAGEALSGVFGGAATMAGTAVTTLISIIAAALVVLGFFVSLFKVFYDAVVLVESKTGAFSILWKELTNIFRTVGAALSPLRDILKELGKELRDAFSQAVLSIAKWMLDTVYAMLGAIDLLRKSWQWLRGDHEAFAKEQSESMKQLAEARKKIDNMTIADLQKIMAQEEEIRKVKRNQNKEDEIKLTYIDKELAKLDTKIDRLRDTLSITKDYSSLLGTIKSKEDLITKQKQAQYELWARQLAESAGLPSQGGEIILKIPGFMGQGAAGAKGLIDSIADAVGMAFGPIGMAIAQLFKLFSMKQEDFNRMITEFFDTIAEIPVRIADNIPVFIQKLVQSIPKIIDGIIQSIPRLIDGLMAMLTDEKFWTQLFDAILNLIPMFLDKLLSMLTEKFTKPEYIIKLVASIIKAIVVGLFNAIVNGFKSAFGILGSIFNIFKQGFEWIVNVFKGVIEFFKNVWDGISSVFRWVGDVFKGAVDLFKGVVDFFKEIVDGIKDTFKKVGETWKNVADGFNNMVGGKGIGSMLSGGLTGGSWGSMVSGGLSDLLGWHLFSRGGIVEALNNVARAQEGLLIGGNTMTGDRTVVRANSGEMILTRDQQRNLFNMISQGRAEGEPRQIIVNLQVGKDKLAETILQLTKDGYRLA